METQQLSLQEVEQLAKDALRGAGASDEAAASVARSTYAAERDGIRSHGLLYVPIYCEHVRCGKVDGQAVPDVTRAAASAIRVDAGSGFAHPAIDAGFEALTAAAGETGCAALTVYNSYNCGVLGYHVERLAEAGFLGLGFTNAPASIAPAGGKTKVIGTNPFGVGVPDGKGGAAMVIDQSASVIAKSEITMRAREGMAIPEGWALDPEGKPTTDPSVALQGTMVPSGGYKGFGVGLLVELLAAALSGATLGKDASPFAGTAGGPPRTGQCFIAVNPDPMSGGGFAERVQGLVEAITAQKGARLPGARRQENRRRILTEGVAVDRKLIETISTFIA